MTRKILLFILTCLLVQALLAENKIVAYYPAWMSSVLPLSDIQYEKITHINHAFAWPNAAGDLDMYTDVPNADLIERAHQHKVKVLISIGGWGHSDAFSPVLADSLKYENFIQNIIDFLQTTQYDGVDFDWEYPSNAADRMNFNTFIQNLRARFREMNEEWLITCAVGTSDWKGQWYDYPTLQQEVDFFNAMCYDYSGSWSAVSGHNAPLFQSSEKQDGSVETGMNYLHQTRGIPANQLVVGIPFYGKMFYATGLYEFYEGEVADLRFSNIYENINNGWRYHWDDQAAVPFLTHSSQTQFITFEDSRSIQEKCNWIKEQGFAGAMVWALGQDIVNGEQPLLTALSTSLKNTKIGKHDSDDLEQVYHLHSNYPNPFNPSTTLEFDLPQAEHVQLTIYNVAGQFIETLVDAPMNAGTHKLQWQAADLPSGVYLYRIQAGSFHDFRRMLLIK